MRAILTFESALRHVGRPIHQFSILIHLLPWIPPLNLHSTHPRIQHNYNGQYCHLQRQRQGHCRPGRRNTISRARTWGSRQVEGAQSHRPPIRVPVPRARVPRLRWHRRQRRPPRDERRAHQMIPGPSRRISPKSLHSRVRRGQQRIRQMTPGPKTPTLQT